MRREGGHQPARGPGNRLGVLVEHAPDIVALIDRYWTPKIDVRMRHVTGAEALIRWQNPEVGLVPFDEMSALLDQARS